MSRPLRRLTTVYDAAEDRLRLAGEAADGERVLLWLTQRLAHRLVSHLCRWLERQGAVDAAAPAHLTIARDLAQSFAQQAARQQQVAAAPVQVDGDGDGASSLASWRVASVDVLSRPDGVELTFLGEAGEAATLPLPTQPLRQWLGIVYDHYRQAEWPTAVWPAWMDEAQPAPTAGASTSVH